MRSFIIAIIICFSPILSQTGYEIAKRVDEKPKPRFLSNKIEMVLKNSRDKTRTKQMISKSMNGGEKQKFRRRTDMVTPDQLQQFKD